MTLELLSKDVIQPGDDDYKDTIDVLKKTTDELYSLLENLLGWAKSQSGNLSIEQEKIEINDLVNSIFLLQKGNLNIKNITFENKVPKSIYAFADLNSIKVVLRNLVSNAIKFTPDKGVITIGANETDENVQVSVADSGVGIPEENIPKLFDSKKHISTYGTNREAGSGLGLVLCKNFVEKNEGKIWVESEVGKGTTFYFTLKKIEN
jgi:two-component system sensor histidine kinase/response regulator